MNKVLIALAALVLPTDALASSWVKVGESRDGTTTAWINTRSIQKGKDFTAGWYRLNLSGGEYAIILGAFNCPTHTYMDVKGAYYERNGSNSSIAGKKTWEMPVPDSIMDGVVSGFCEDSWND